MSEIQKNPPNLDKQKVRKLPEDQFKEKIHSLLGSGGPNRSSNAANASNGLPNLFTDFEIDLENPLVEISMDEDAWFEFICTHEQAMNEWVTLQRSTSDMEDRRGFPSLPRADMVKKVTLQHADGIFEYTLDGLSSQIDSAFCINIPIWKGISEKIRKKYGEAGVGFYEDTLEDLTKKLLFNLEKSKYYPYVTFTSGSPKVSIKENILSLENTSTKVEITNFRIVLQIVLEIIFRMQGHQEKVELTLDPPPFDEVEAQNVLEAARKFSSKNTLLAQPDEAVLSNLDALEVKEIHLRLTDLGGNKKAKAQIEELIELTKDPEYFLDGGSEAPRGYLFFGPPGTGKTLIAKIIAGECGRTFYHIDTPDILSKYFGDSEKILKDILTSVENNSIIFFDEIDSIGGDRDHASEPMRRVLNVLLKAMDGIKNEQDRDIIIIGATNRRDAIDPALLRRFDEQLFVELPDEQGRHEIWNIHVEKIRQKAKREIITEIDLTTLAKESEGLSGDDIAVIIKRAVRNINFRNKKHSQEDRVSTEILIETMHDFLHERKSQAAERKIGF